MVDGLGVLPPPQTPRGNFFLQNASVALGAFDQWPIANFLHGLKLVATIFAAILVYRHLLYSGSFIMRLKVAHDYKKSCKNTVI